ncbi:MAG: glycosyltransferase family 4 protein [Myxococcaceae bacterium]
MKVLFLNQFFPPDLAPTGQMAMDLAHELIARGHSVSALTGQASYVGGKRLAREEVLNGVEIHRVATTSFGRRSVLHRLADYSSFYVTATAELARLPRHDVVITMTSPPLISMAGPLAQRLKKSAFVYWVHDLYPEAAIAFGVMKTGSATARAAAATSRFTLSRADRTVVLGEAMKERVVVAGAREDRVSIIPNWIDDEVVTPIPHSKNPLRAELSRGRKCLVMYSGNIGRGHDVETLLAAARKLSDEKELGFVFIGEGVKREEGERAAQQLPNGWRAPYAPREQLAQSLSAADIHFISLSNELVGLLEPSKLYGVMAAGRPAIFVGPGRSEVALTVEREGCGVRVDNGDVEGLMNAIVTFAENKAKREAFGARGRSALSARYSRKRAAARWDAVLRELR